MFGLKWSSGMEIPGGSANIPQQFGTEFSMKLKPLNVFHSTKLRPLPCMIVVQRWWYRKTFFCKRWAHMYIVRGNMDVAYFFSVNCGRVDVSERALMSCRPQMCNLGHIIISADIFEIKCANQFWMNHFFSCSAAQFSNLHDSLGLLC